MIIELRRVAVSVVAALVVIISGNAPASVLHVPSEYPRVQAGINAAAPGDTVLVAPGTYTGAGNRALDFGGKDIALIGEGGAEATVIDCEGVGRGIHFHSGETRTSLVRGFTITSAYVPQGVDGGAIRCAGSSPTLDALILELNSASSGAGLSCVAGSDPLVRSCVIRNNIAHYRHGGGAIVGDSAPEFIDCTFGWNMAEVKGGAVWIADDATPKFANVSMLGSISERGGAVYVELSGASFVGCTFDGNSCTTMGGAVRLESPSAVVIHDSEFSDNYANAGAALRSESGTLTISDCDFYENETGSGGGAANIKGTGTCQISGTQFRDNTAVVGGALVCHSSAPVVSECIFDANSADTGGALYCLGGAAPHVSHCVFLDNSADSGGAVALDGSAVTLESSSFSGNTAQLEGSSLYCSGLSSATASGSVIVFGTYGEAVSVSTTSSASLSCCDIFGNAGGDWTGSISGQNGIYGNFSGDPLFCIPFSADVTVCADSPCLPGNHPYGYECGTIGAAGQGCPPCGGVDVEPASWGSLKAKYR